MIDGRRNRWWGGSIRIWRMVEIALFIRLLVPLLAHTPIRNSTIHSADSTHGLPIRQDTRVPRKDSVLFQGPLSNFTNSGIL